MTKKELKKLLDSWLSKKWLITVMCFTVGTYKILFMAAPMTAVEAGFLTSIVAVYGGINVANKASVLKHTEPEKWEPVDDETT